MDQYGIHQSQYGIYQSQYGIHQSHVFHFSISAVFVENRGPQRSEITMSLTPGLTLVLCPRSKVSLRIWDAEIVCAGVQTPIISIEYGMVINPIVWINIPILRIPYYKWMTIQKKTS